MIILFKKIDNNGDEIKIFVKKNRLKK